ncbi:MAG TPA: acetylglutamate kinase [Chitinophagales bacterium]|nr:acetylglutamate kinase [Chitinophagales bacterium]
MKELLVIKIGGNIIDDDKALASFLEDFASVNTDKILVHGGGKLATRLSTSLGIETKMEDGRRVTDEETIKVVTMAYAGWINKNIVAKLQAKGCNALGLCGADASVIPAVKRPVGKIDYGWVGDIESKNVNINFLSGLINQNITPVFAPVSSDGSGNLLNINADTIARTIAEAMSTEFETRLIYCFEKRGLLMNVEDDSTLINEINAGKVEELKQYGVITAGMLPKIDNALGAISGGVSEVVIGHAAHIKHIAQKQKGYGTYITA